MTNDCPPIEADLKAYADRALPWPRRLIVRRHLARCAACREELTAMTQIAEELHAAETPDTALDPALRAKLLANLPTPSSQTPPELGAGGRSFRLPSAWQLVGVGAIFLVMWAVLFPVFQPAREKARQISSASIQKQDALFQSQATRNHGEVNSEVSVPAFSAGPPPASVTRQVHKEATLAVQVTDAEAKSDQVAQIVKGVGGFVASNTLATGDDGRRSADLTVKVPVVQFETVLNQVARLGDVTAKNITGEDITEKTSDADQAEAVLEDAVHRADAHLAALGKKAGWRDQQDAQDTRIQLAQARARLQLLRKMAALSTLTLSLTERPKPAAAAPVTSGFFGGLGDSTRAATASLLASTGALLSLLIWLLAFAPLWVPLAFVGHFLYRRYQQAAA